MRTSRASPPPGTMRHSPYHVSQHSTVLPRRCRPCILTNADNSFFMSTNCGHGIHKPQRSERDRTHAARVMRSPLLCTAATVLPEQAAPRHRRAGPTPPVPPSEHGAQRSNSRCSPSTRLLARAQRRQRRGAAGPRHTPTRRRTVTLSGRALHWRGPRCPATRLPRRLLSSA